MGSLEEIKIESTIISVEDRAKLEQSMNIIIDANKDLKAIEDKQKALKESSDAITSIKETNAEIVKELLEKYKVYDYNSSDEKMFAHLCTRTTTGYTKYEENKILSILKEQNLTNCISVKESLSKSNLKKELKTNATLQESLKDFGQEKETTFVQVLTAEDDAKRQEKIDEALNKK